MKTYAELLADFEKLKRDIDAVREYEATLIVERVMALLEERGVDAQEIFKTAPLQRKVRKTKHNPRYWDPRTGATWSGRGRTPVWLTGKDRETFRIPAEGAGEQES